MQTIVLAGMWTPFVAEIPKPFGDQFVDFFLLKTGLQIHKTI
jgi:hypothetical protein